MIDFHIHTSLTDGKDTPEEMLAAAEAKGLREICFTEHMERRPGMVDDKRYMYTQEEYENAFGHLRSNKLIIRQGMEFGLMNNRDCFLEEIAKRKYDFIIGSLHFVDQMSVNRAPYWEGKTEEQVYTRYLETIIEMLKLHRDFHVLGHLTNPTKSVGNPAHRPFSISKYGDLTEEIFKRLITMGIGIEINTGSVSISGEPMPPLAFVKQYVEMGGEIVTIGSDAHCTKEVGFAIPEILRQLKEITPWICTFAGGEPVFHKIESLIY